MMVFRDTLCIAALAASWLSEIMSIFNPWLLTDQPLVQPGGVAAAIASPSPLFKVALYALLEPLAVRALLHLTVEGFNVLFGCSLFHAAAACWVLAACYSPRRRSRQSDAAGSGPAEQTSKPDASSTPMVYYLIASAAVLNGALQLIVPVLTRDLNEETSLSLLLILGFLLLFRIPEHFLVALAPYTTNQSVSRLDGMTTAFYQVLLIAARAIFRVLFGVPVLPPLHWRAAGELHDHFAAAHAYWKTFRPYTSALYWTGLAGSGVIGIMIGLVWFDASQVPKTPAEHLRALDESKSNGQQTFEQK